MEKLENGNVVKKNKVEKVRIIKLPILLKCF